MHAAFLDHLSCKSFDRQMAGVISRLTVGLAPKVVLEIKLPSITKAHAQEVLSSRPDVIKIFFKRMLPSLKKVLVLSSAGAACNLPLAILIFF